MEKRKPHYDLSKIKELISKESTRGITEITHKNAASLGYMDVDAILDVIYSLNRRHFYKSMTVYDNPGLWQDVYKIEDEDRNIKLYIKLQITKMKGIIIQFKRDEEGD